MPKQASLFGSDVRHESPLKGHSLWDLALIMPGLARRVIYDFHFSWLVKGVIVSPMPEGIASCAC